MKLEKLGPVGPKEFSSFQLSALSSQLSAFSFGFLSADKNECSV